MSKRSTPNYLEVLESAITDVGVWQWWTAIGTDTFQLEFGATQLWMPPTEKGQPPSGQVALRFRKPRLVQFLTFDKKAPARWPDLMHEDQLPPMRLDAEGFTLTNAASFRQFTAAATRSTTLIGGKQSNPTPAKGEAFIAIASSPGGVIVIAESMAVFGHKGELSPKAVIESSAKWWEYWQTYWKRRDSKRPMPQDYTCEVTIPAGPG